LPSGQKLPQTEGDPDAFDTTIQDSQFRSIQEENFEESIPHSKKPSISESIEVNK
jgi:hypothetical protein